MKTKEVEELLKYLAMSYSSFSFNETKLKYWLTELQQYDCNDVKYKLKELMSSGEYKLVPPVLETITSGLTKNNKKVNFKDMVCFCKICNRAFNQKQELEKHEERCRSVKYIIKQYEKYSLGIIDKRTLYTMNDEEFDVRYAKLLKYVQSHTDNLSEKTRIEFIFNPPSYEKAKEFLTN